MAESQHPQTDDETGNRPLPWVIPGVAMVAVLSGVYIFVAGSQTTRSGRMPRGRRHMQMIGLAVHQYLDEYGSFPPAFIESNDGTPMHSWRVLILPHLADQYDEQAVGLKEHRYDGGFWRSWGYRDREQIAREKAKEIRDIVAAYDFSEPWDGPNNRPLADLALDVFCCHQEGSHPTTDFLAVVGPETVWPEDEVRRPDDFHDGFTQTILVVEVSDSDILWSEPRDIHFDSMSFAVNDSSEPGIRGHYPSGAYVLFSDGHATWMPDDVDPAEVRAMLTIDGQENISTEF